MSPHIPDVLPAADDAHNRHGAITVSQAVQAEADRLFSELTRKGTAPNTARAYATDFRYFTSWHQAALSEEPHIPIAAEVLQLFVGQHVEGLPDDVARAMLEDGFLKVGPEGQAVTGKVSTLRRRVSSLSRLHKLAGVPDDINPARELKVTSMLGSAAKIAAAAGERSRKARPITREILDRLLETCEDDSLKGKRDRALLLFGFAAGGRRRSEICAAVLEDLHVSLDPNFPQALAYEYYLPRHKGDQVGDGANLPLKGRAAVAMKGWLEAAGIREGRIFRSVDRWENLGEELTEDGLNRIVKARAAAAGLDPAAFSPHSLRSGFATESGLQGVPEAEARAMTRHKSVAVFAGYQQPGNLLRSKASRMAG